MGCRQILQDEFACQLGAAVGIDRQSRRGLVDRIVFGRAIDCGCRREDHVAHASFRERVEHGQGFDGVVGVVFRRLGNRLLNAHICCEVDRGFDAGLREVDAADRDVERHDLRAPWIGGADEHDMRQIKRLIEIMVGKAEILLRVESSGSPH